MIGIDIIEIDRIKKIQNNDKLLKKIFYENEINYINKFKCKSERLAGYFCAKESVIKAFEGKISFLDFEICHKNNKPFILLHEKAKKIFELNNFKNIEISISHSKTVATAVCQIL